MNLDTLDYDDVKTLPNPLDAVEHVLSTYNLDYVRMDDDELALSVAGQCTSYHLFLTWQNEFGALQIICQFPHDMPLPDNAALARVFMLANAQLWMGHFELSDERYLQFRYTAMLRPMGPAGGVDHMNDLFKLAVAECDRFYPAARMICDNSSAPDAALMFAMQDIMGQS
jgi:hypothetical protein